MQTDLTRNSTRGSALLVVIVFIALAAGLGLALLGLDVQTGRSRKQTASEQRAFYSAEAAINEALAALATGAIDPAPDTTVEFGTPLDPRILGPSRHWAILSRVDQRRYSIIGVGLDADRLTRHELMVGHAPNGLFQYAAFGDHGVRIDSNAFIDSYDSLFGAYAGQVVAGTDRARQNAVVGSNSDIHLRSNTTVHGDCHPGPGGVVYATAPGILVTGSTDPASELVLLAPIPVPSASSLGSAAWGTDVTVGPGIVRYDDVLVDNGSTLTICGPAQLVMENFRMRSGTRVVFDASGGPIEVYAAHDFVLESNADVISQSDSAVDVKLFLSGDNRNPNRMLRDEVSLSANSDFVGAIHAPNSAITLDSNFKIFGSVMAGWIDLSSNGVIHFDEALLYDDSGAAREFETVLWRRLQRTEI